MVTKEKDIVEVMMDADKAPVPGSEDKVFNKETDEIPVSMSVTELRSAGWVYIYDTKTREQSVTNRNMLPTQLKKTRPDGSKVFTTAKPDKPPIRGIGKCWLHPDNPNREHYTEMGLPVCSKRNLANDFQVTQHMKTKHRQEYATIMAETERKEREEEKLLRYAIIKNIPGKIRRHKNDIKKS